MESHIVLSKPSTPQEEDFDLEAPRKEKPDLDEIKTRLYQKECNSLGITPVGAFMRAPSRDEVSIRHYGLGPVGAGALSVPLMLDSAMTRLDLEGNAIGGEGLANMFEMLVDHCSLTHLSLRDNNLGSRGASLICQVLETNKLLVSVNLADNEFVDTDGSVFANMLQVNKTLKSLNLSHNKMGHLAGKCLGDALSQNENLDTLDISWNQFREGGAAKLLEGVKDNIGLKKLTLAFNAFNRGLCKRPIDALGLAISGNSSLQYIDASNNRLGDLDLFKVAKSLKENENLETLKIGQNLVSFRAAGVLMKAVLFNENSRIKLLDMTDLPIAECDIRNVDELRSRDVKVIHGRIHQKETSFESNPGSPRPKKGGNEKKQAADNTPIGATGEDNGKIKDNQQTVSVDFKIEQTLPDISDTDPIEILHEFNQPLSTGVTEDNDSEQAESRENIHDQYYGIDEERQHSNNTIEAHNSSSLPESDDETIVMAQDTETLNENISKEMIDSLFDVEQ